MNRRSDSKEYAHLEGQKAFKKGLHMDQNPYEIGSGNRQEWYAGYLLQRAIANGRAGG